MSQQGAVYSNSGFQASFYSGEEVFDNLGEAPISLNKGKAFAKAGVIDIVAIEGLATSTFGKKSISFYPAPVSLK